MILERLWPATTPPVTEPPEVSSLVALSPPIGSSLSSLVATAVFTGAVSSRMFGEPDEPFAAIALLFPSSAAT